MAGDEKRVKVKIDHVEKIYDGRKGDVYKRQPLRISTTL